MATRPILPDTGTIASTIEPLADLRPVQITTAPIEDPASLGDVFHASSTLAQQDSSVFDDHMLAQGYAPIVSALGLPSSENPAEFQGTDAAGEARFGYMGSPSQLATSAKRGNVVPFGSNYLADRTQQEQLVAEQIHARRLTDPKFLPGVPDSVDGLHKYFLEQQKAIRQQAEQTLARSPGGLGGFGATIAGGAVGTFHDPMNVATLAIPGGEGKTVLQIMARDALINGMLELGQQPLVAKNRAELGAPALTTGDVVSNVASAAVGGAAFGTAVHGVGRGLSRLVGQPDLAATRAYQLFAALPQRLKQKYGAGIVTKWGARIASGDNLEDVFSELDNHELADVSRAVIGGDKMTPEETAAANVIQRGADVAASSPYKPGPVGDGVHENTLAGAIKEIGDANVATAANAAPAVEAARPPASLSSDRRPQPGNVEAAIASFQSKVGHAENATGNIHAKNPKSSASGPAQFTDPTFRDYYKKVYGTDPGEHPAASLKDDPKVQAVLLNRLSHDNAAHLQGLGEAVNDGNLYLEHFLGSGDAAKVFKAQPETPIERVLSADVLNRNDFLKGKSASETIAWAHDKMGRSIASVGARPGFSSTLDAASDDPAIAQLRAEAMQLDDQVIGATRRLDGTPVNLYTRQVPASSIVVDATRFQFKTGGDEFGVTDRLQGVERWDPALSGRVMLWEGADGRLFVADGHQRVGLAKRVGAAQNVDIPMDGMILREADGISADEARTLAALKNVGEGTGSAIDAAKVVRGAGLAALRRLPPKSALVRDAAALSKLSDEAFGAVYNGVVPPDFAAVIGQLLPDSPEMHGAMIELLKKADPPNRGQAESIIRQGISAGLHSEHQVDLFGEHELTTSLFGERAKVLERGLAELRKMKLVHKTAAENAGTLEATGSTIAKERSAQEAQANAQAAEIVDRLAFSAGPVADALNVAARELKDGAKLTAVARDFAERVRKLDLAELGRDTGNGADLNGGGRGGEAGEAFATVPEEQGNPAEPSFLADADEQPTLPEIEAATERFSDPDGKAVKQQAESLVHDAKAERDRAAEEFRAKVERKRAEFAKMDFSNPDTKLPGQGGDRSLAIEQFRVNHNPEEFKAALDKNGIAMLPSQDVFRLRETPNGVELIEDRSSEYRDGYREHIDTYGVGKGWTREEAIQKAADYYFAPFGREDAPNDYELAVNGKGAIGRNLVRLVVTHDPEGRFLYRTERNYSQGGGDGGREGYDVADRFATLEEAKQAGLRSLYRSYEKLATRAPNITAADTRNWEKLVKPALEKELKGPPPSSHISDHVAEQLERRGFKRNGNELEIKLPAVEAAGQLSKGDRVLSIRISEDGRYLERMDGFNVANDVDLREFEDKPKEAIAAVLDGIPTDYLRAINRPLAPSKRIITPSQSEAQTIFLDRMPEDHHVSQAEAQRIFEALDAGATPEQAARAADYFFNGDSNGEKLDWQEALHHALTTEMTPYGVTRTAEEQARVEREAAQFQKEWAAIEQLAIDSGEKPDAAFAWTQGYWSGKEGRPNDYAPGTKHRAAGIDHYAPIYTRGYERGLADRAAKKPELVRFASGMSRNGDLRAGAYALGESDKMGVGVEAGELSNAGIDTIAHAIVDWRTDVFVDSGAFGLFRKNLREAGNRLDLGADGKLDFDKILAKYDEIEKRIGDYNEAEIPASDRGRLLLVMPDVVGDQAASLELLRRYEHHIKTQVAFQEGGTIPIVPLQKGELTLEQAWEEAAKILGTKDFVVGIPSNEAALSTDEFRQFLEHAQPWGIHFLGAASDKTLGPKLDVLNKSGIELHHLTADANLLRSKFYGRTKELGDRPTAVMETLRKEDLALGSSSAKQFAEDTAAIAARKAENPLDLGAQTDPAIADRQRQETQLGAAAPMRGPQDVAQHGEIGLPLMDAVDQFRLEIQDEAKTLLDELDADEKAVKSIKDCL